eukprot:TRINITY_DN2901_c0_g2_i3.p1 TRINITY_DN2901_c0_g2~~TRINITY_DN2901_c0_g2_i3.p1  ORF type:complete len:393 (-),score=41.56 TRINITY_DN2901_c0_g2_i3:26-1204(-)
MTWELFWDFGVGLIGTKSLTTTSKNTEDPLSSYNTKATSLLFSSLFIQNILGPIQSFRTCHLVNGRQVLVVSSWMKWDNIIFIPSTQISMIYRQPIFLRLLGVGLLYFGLVGALLFRRSPIFIQHFFWNPWLFSSVPRSFWKDFNNQRRYLDWLGAILKVKTFADWYKCTTQIFFQRSGGGLFYGSYKCSRISLLRNIYPEHNWNAWEFSFSPQFFWREMSEEDQIRFFLWIEEKLNISEPDDWYRIGTRQLEDIGVYSSVQELGGISGILEKNYPEIIWDRSLLLTSNKKSEQRQWREIIRGLFPGYQILEDHKHPDLKFRNSGRKMELDIFLPEMNLAFEYQGHQHFHSSKKFGSVDTRRVRDEEKRKACLDEGTTHSFIFFIFLFFLFC